MSPVRASRHFYPKNRSNHDALPVPKVKPKDDSAGMNKGEMRYASVLDQRIVDGHVAGWYFEHLSIKLADNTFYKPDFLVILADGSVELHEVKGASKGSFVVTESGWVKIKVTAKQSPFPVVVVWQEKSGQWREERP